MTKEKEIALEALPAPGEPLAYHVHEDNQALLEEELKQRAAGMAGRLSQKLYRQIEKRYKYLHRRLNKLGYNAYIQQRWATHQGYEAIKHEYTQAVEACQLNGSKANRAKLQQLASDGRALAAQGQWLNSMVKSIQPMADEFESLSNRMTNHRAALEYEREDKSNRQEFYREAQVWEAQIKSVMRQSARLHHVGKNSDGKEFIVIPQIERIIFKDDRVLYLIKTTSQTPIERLLGKWHSALPYNVDVTDMDSEVTLKNLAAACNRVVTVERSKRGTNFFYALSRLDSPDGIPKMALYSKVMGWYPTKDHTKTPWMAGVTENRKAEAYNFEQIPHILIAGSTNSGKSNHVNQMIATLVTMNTPAEVRMLLIDNKGGIEFTHWAGVKHLLRPMIKKVGDVLPALQFVRAIMDRRLAIFESMKTKNLESFNRKVKAEGRLPRIIVVIDEMATLLGLGTLTTDIQGELRVLTSQGRAVGVHIIICTQHSSVDVLPNWVKTNMVMRISGKMPSIAASMVILDSATAATLPNLPGRMVFSQGRFEVIAQSPFISDSEIARAVEISQNFDDPDNREFDPETADEPILIDERMGRDDVITLALERYEGKLTPSRMHEYLGNEIIPLRRLREIVDSIVKPGIGSVIEHCGSHYRIKRIGNTYALEPVESDAQPDVEQSNDPTAVDPTLLSRSVEDEEE